MKFLKFLLYLIVILFVIGIILYFLGDKDYDVSRTKNIDAPTHIVWNEVSSLGAMAKWGPWNRLDPDQKLTFHGTDGEVGAYSHWEGEKTGVGEQKIISIEPGVRIETELNFIEPWYMAGKSNAYINVNANGTGSDVIWGLKGKNGTMAKIMSVFMDMDGNVGPMYEEGLGNLSEIVMKKKEEMDLAMAEVAKSGYDINDIETQEQHFLVKRETVAWKNMPAFYGEHFGSMMMALAAAEMNSAGMPRGLFYHWDQENQTADMCAAIPIPSREVNIPGYEVVTLPASKTLHVAHYGDYGASEAAHIAIDNYMKANGMELIGPCHEEYANDPTEVKPEEVLTNIFYPYKEI